MDYFNTSAGAAGEPIAPAAPANPFFTSGNSGLGVPATVPGPWWFHMITKELRNLITSAGLTPDHTNLNQISQAVVALIKSANRAVILENAVFEASVTNGEAVYWDAANNRFDEAIADGTVKQNAVGFADVTNEKVYAFGDTPLFTGLTPGAKYYLSGTVAGAITATVPTANIVQVGIAKTATELLADIDAAGAGGNEAGAVQTFARNTPPSGWLKANGALVSRTTYASLFAAIGTTFGAGDGSTTFGLPDLRGEFIRGWADDRAVDTGRVFGSFQADEFRSHSHTYPNGGTGGSGAPVLTNGVGSFPSTSATGGAETRPRNVALLACIKF